MEWKEVRLGDVCEIKGGKRLPKGVNLITQKNSHPYIRVRDLGKSKTIELNSSYEYVDEITQKQIQRYITQKGDILISIVGTIGLIAIVGGSLDGANLTENCVKLVKLDKIDTEYLYYYLKSPFGQQNISRGTVGAVQAKLPIKNIQDFSIICPELISDQHRIASILSSLDRKIELNNKINDDLEEMAQAIFKNWFVDFEPFKDGKFVDSELGMIPEGWKIGTLTDVIKLMPGGTPKTSEPLYWDNGTIPFFSPKDVNGVYCFTTEKHITETGLNKCSSNLYPKDTIFITCRGTVGKVCLAACDMAMNQSNYAIKAIDGYSQCYVFFLVKSVVERLIKKSNGAVFSAITSKDFDEEILIPSQKAVEDFTNVIDGFFRRIFTIGTENSRLSLLRDTLLPRLMSGEIEVPE